MYIQAEWIIPISAPPIQNGWIRVENGLIMDIGEESSRPTTLDEPLQNLGAVAVFPGLINAHCHLEFGRQDHPRDSFAAWAQSVQQSQQRDSFEEMTERWNQNVRRLIATGTTTVANHCNRMPDIGRVLSSRKTFDPRHGGRSQKSSSGHPSQLPHMIHICEIVGSDPTRAAESYRNTCAQQLEILNEQGQATISPTSLYAVAPQVLEDFFKNRDPDSLVSVHLKESHEENDLFKDKRGALAQLVKVKGGDLWLTDPMTWLREKNRLGPSTLIIHGNYLSDSDVGTLQGTGASVIHCPGSHAYFGHQRFPLEALQNKNINIALGTDSLASNDDLSMLNELRRVRDQYSGLSLEEIVRMATINGAEALGIADERGSIETGKSADLIAVPCSVEDPYEALFNAETTTLTMIAGTA